MEVQQAAQWIIGRRELLPIRQFGGDSHQTVIADCASKNFLIEGVRSVPKHRTLTLDAFAAYLEARPASLGCWRDGAPGRYPTLAWLNVHPVTEQRKLVSQVGPQAAVMMTTAADHNRVGIAAGWVTQYMTGPSKASRASHEDRVALFNTAGGYWELRNAIVEVRVRVRDFEAEGPLVRMPFKGNRAIEALDRLLEFVDRLDAATTPPNGPDPRLRKWLIDEGLSRPWASVPPWVKDTFRQQASKLLASYAHYLAGDVMVAGIAMAEIDRFWVELLAWGLSMHAATILGSTHLPTICPLVPRNEFVDGLAINTDLSPYVVDRIVGLLTLDLARCSDGGLTPLVPIDDCIVPMSSLIIPNSPHRNLLAIVQHDPSMFGEAGRLLGDAGELATVRVLGRLRPEALVAKRIRVVRADGTRAGDLDVVACDPATRTAVVLEIKWGIAADGNAEAYRTEQVAITKRAQVVRLRNEVESGAASPRWPHGWPEMTGYKFRWFVLTRDVLAMRDIENDGVTIRSHQLLNRTLRAEASVKDLISVLDTPPEPPADLCDTLWNRIRYGDLRVDLETIAV